MHVRGLQFPTDVLKDPFSSSVCVRVCVCVELLNRSKTTTAASFSAFWFQQGAVAHSWVHCQNQATHWVGRISGLIIPTYLQRSYFLDMGRGQPKNHLAEQFAVSLHWLCHTYVAAIWDLLQSFQNNFWLHYAGYGDGRLLILFRVSSPQDAVSPSGNTCLGRMFDPPTWSLNIHF